MFSRLISRIVRPTGRRPGRRTDYVYLTTYSYKFAVALRHFRTTKPKRSRLHRQFVLPIYFLPIREIAIRRLGPHRPSIYKVLLPLVRQLQLQISNPRFVPLLIALGAAGIILFGSQLGNYTDLQPVAQAVAPPPPAVVVPAKPETLSRAQPTRIRIARLALDAPLSTVGNRLDGTIHVPNPLWLAGWYKHGPSPGELGPAIIVGHIGRAHERAVFWRLGELRPGDIVDIQRADGRTAKFKIDKIKNFPKSDFPTAKVYGDIDNAGLRLISCGGDFDRRSHQYSHNIVVFGSLID